MLQDLIFNFMPEKPACVLSFDFFSINENSKIYLLIKKTQFVVVYYYKIFTIAWWIIKRSLRGRSKITYVAFMSNESYSLRSTNHTSFIYSEFLS